MALERISGNRIWARFRFAEFSEMSRCDTAGTAYFSAEAGGKNPFTPWKLRCLVRIGSMTVVRGCRTLGAKRNFLTASGRQHSNSRVFPRRHFRGATRDARLQSLLPPMWFPSEDGSRAKIPVRGIPFDVSYTLEAAVHGPESEMCCSSRAGRASCCQRLAAGRARTDGHLERGVRSSREVA